MPAQMLKPSPVQVDRAKVVVEYEQAYEEGTPMLLRRLLVNGEPVKFKENGTFIGFEYPLITCQIAFNPQSIEFVRVEREEE